MERIKVAYLLLVHKDAEYVNMLVNQLLNEGDSDVYIHVDVKAKDIIKKIICSDRVSVISKWDVSWGGYSIVGASLDLMHEAGNSGRYYSHMYLGSGQDIMVKKGFHEFLADHKNTVFIKMQCKLEDGDRGSAKYMLRWPKSLLVRDNISVQRAIRALMFELCKRGILIRKNKRKRPEMDIWQGWTWFVAPFGALQYICEYTDKNPDYVAFWEESLAPDIMFFQTLLMNSKYGRDIQDSLMYIRFGDTKITNNHPVTIRMDEINKIEAGNWFFARKVEQTEDRQVIEYFNNKTR